MKTHLDLKGTGFDWNDFVWLDWDIQKGTLSHIYDVHECLSKTNIEKFLQRSHATQPYTMVPCRA